MLAHSNRMVLRTIILVSHRLSTVIACDQIFVMEAGRIAEHGTHHQLLARRGAYWVMASAQQCDEPPEPPQMGLAA